jgi:hypothetical protein
MRLHYELNEDEYKEMQVPSHVPYLLGSDGTPPLSPQEVANLKWQKLAEQKGFIWDSVRPSDRGPRFFTAEVDPATHKHKFRAVDFHLAECACGETMDADQFKRKQIEEGTQISREAVEALKLRGLRNEGQE